MYTRGEGKDRIILMLFVDDALTVCHKDRLEKWREEFNSGWEIRDYGEPATFLGCDIYLAIETVRQSDYISRRTSAA